MHLAGKASCQVVVKCSQITFSLHTFHLNVFTFHLLFILHPCYTKLAIAPIQVEKGGVSHVRYFYILFGVRYGKRSSLLHMQMA